MQLPLSFGAWRFGAALLAGAMAAPCAGAFDFNDVAREADRLARAPYRQPPAADPALAALSYDAYRKQRFRPEFVHLARQPARRSSCSTFRSGAASRRALTLLEVVGDEVRPLRVPAGMFEGGAPAGAAGWRAEPLGRQAAAQSDEVVAFLGASYFRLVAQALRYGVSARGLARRHGGRNRRGVPRVHHLLGRATRSRATARAAFLTRCSSRRASPAPTRSCCRPGLGHTSTCGRG